MKLLRHGEPGSEQPGILDAEGMVRDLSAIVPDIAGSILYPDGLAEIRKADPGSLPLVDRQVRLGPCVSGTGKIICIGLNYADHAEESGMEVPPEPVVFMKATSAICGPNDDVVIPPGSTRTDWEVELSIVIGQTARYIDEGSATEHIAGYCVINDLSEREYQLERSGQWVKGKSADTFAPIGPWLVTVDEVPDPLSLSLFLEVDGRRMQDGNTRTMVYPPAFLVAYLSQFMSLHPGDIISTGTPPGVGLGQDPPWYLRPGMTMRLGIEGLGEQVQRVVSADTGGQESGQ